MLACDLTQPRPTRNALLCLVIYGGMIRLLPAEGFVFGAPVPEGLASLLGALSPVVLTVLILPVLSLWPTSLVSVGRCRLSPDHENQKLQLGEVQVSFATTPSNQKN